MFSIVCYTNCCKVNVLLVQTKKRLQINSKLAKFVTCKKWNFYPLKSHWKKVVYKFFDSCVYDKTLFCIFFSNMINEINNINLILTTLIRIFYYLWYYAMYLDLQFQKSEVKFIWKPSIVQYVSPCYFLLQNALILAIHRLIIIEEAYLFLRGKISWVAKIYLVREEAIWLVASSEKF